MTPEGLARLKLDEGLRLKAYPDPSTGGKPWTIGYGSTGPDISKETVWTREQADTSLLARVKLLETQLGQRLKFFNTLSPVRQDVLVNIAYNIGVTGLLRWSITLKDIDRGDFAQVAIDLRSNNVWKRQVGERENRCATAFETNKW